MTDAWENAARKIAKRIEKSAQQPRNKKGHVLGASKRELTRAERRNLKKDK